jgi:hypothetical protein
MELAPQGWLECVRAVAAGFTQQDNGRAFCLCCGNAIDGEGGGHHATCLTRVARDIIERHDVHLALYFNLDLRQPASGVDIDAVHRGRDKLTDT